MAELSASRAVRWVPLFLMLYFVYGYRPLVAEPFQYYDDYTYLTQAEAITRWLRGEESRWLGSYTTITLAKAPLFAIWLSLLHLFSFPLRLAEFLILVPAPFCFAIAFRPVQRLSSWKLAVLALLFVGLPFLSYDLRLLRSALHASLVLAFLISAMGLMLRASEPLAARSRWSLAVGGLFGLNYLNREEAIWLLPIGVAALATSPSRWLRSERWLAELRPFALASLAALLLIGSVSLLNLACYGLLATTQRRAAGFTTAYQTLTRLEPRSRERFVPITAATRARAYALSPSFARLRDSLEGPPSDGIATHPGHLALHGRQPGDREFFVATFDFALRQAMFHSGARSAREMEQLSEQIARELEHAIERGEIEAGASGPALLTPPLPGDYAAIARNTLAALGHLFSVQDIRFPTAPAVSEGDPLGLQRIQAISSNAIAPTREALEVCSPPPFAALRSAALAAALRVQQSLYLVGCAAALLVPLWFAVASRGRAPALALIWTGATLAGAALIHSASIAALHVLGWPVLSAGGAYNNFGLLPISVTAAFGLGLLAAWPSLRARAAACARGVAPRSEPQANPGHLTWP